MVWGIQVLVPEVYERDCCCETGFPVGCVATICRVAVTIATSGIRLVAGRHKLAAGIIVITTVELSGDCETGSFNYYGDRDYRLTCTWDALNGPMLVRMSSLSEEIIARLCTITVTPMSFVLAKAQPWLQTWSDRVQFRQSSVLVLTSLFDVPSEGYVNTDIIGLRCIGLEGRRFLG
ncbi:unnamed protein product [Lactuca saligna]|uniref:Uncharacterized protein n=1 Tax=Lactuca saligna TaxID=75948 RepID=A0AA35YFF4_LACSI|nr:unnamed protein product [Lactuca saligna]